MISIRSTKDIGIKLRLTEPPPPRDGEPTVRRPLIRTAVRAAPAPRKLNVAFDCAELPDDSRNEPSELSVDERSASATETSPVSFMSAAVIETTY